MKRFTLFALLAGITFLSTGCGTPGYTTGQRFRQIGRTWKYEGGQAVDDFDHVLLLRPPSTLTKWNVR